MTSSPKWILNESWMKHTAVAVGMFDGVHRGHQALVRELRRCAQERGLEACVITFADHPMRHICPEKAPRLLTTCSQKAQYLRQAGADEVLALDFNDDLRRLTAREFMRMISDRLGVRLWMLGFYHRFGSDGIRDFADYARIGAGLGIDVELAGMEVIDGMHLPVSSSLVREALADGRIDEACIMLGRHFSIIGTVEAGQRIGRTIGFPTANVKPLMAEQAIPAGGVYACSAVIDGAEWPAMTNIGCRPTIGQGLSSTIETHVIGFEGDLYDREIEVRFLRRLRDERKFDSLDDLRRQLNFDLKNCLESQK